MNDIDADAIKALEDARNVLDWLGENYTRVSPRPDIKFADILNASVFLEALLLAIGQEGMKARADTLMGQDVLP